MFPTDNNPATEILKEEKSFFASLDHLSFQGAIDKLANEMIHFGAKVIVAIIVFYIGKFIIKKLYGLCRTLMEARGTDPSLVTFTLSLLRIVLYFIVIVTVIGILGIETSSFLALFASAGVAIGMALSGTLQNFAGGVLILLLKPYRVGDYIEAQGYTGTVKEIQIFNTIINTIDNKAIIIPNGGLSTGTINNYSLEDYRRVDWTICLSYDTDYYKAEQVIKDMLLSDRRVVRQFIEDDRLSHLEENNAPKEVLADEAPVTDCEKEYALGEEVSEVCKDKKPSRWRLWRIRRKLRHSKLGTAIKNGISVVEKEKKDCSPFVGLSEMADSSINLTVRAWTRSSDYWPLYFEMNRRFFTELPLKGFSFPFPQLDVHVNPQA